MSFEGPHGLFTTNKGSHCEVSHSWNALIPHLNLRY